MNYAALKAELLDDPLSRGYAGMSDEAAAVDLNTAYQTRTKDSLTGDEVFQATDAGEFNSATEHKQQLWMAFCARDTIDPRNTAAANIALLDHVFGADSTTKTNLLVLRIEDITRAADLWLGTVKVGHVEIARAL